AVRKIAVTPERQFAKYEITHRIEPVSIDELLRRDEIVQRFRHLLSLDGPPAMGEDATRRLETGSHQEGRPIDRMKPHDVLADDVNIGRPESRKLRTFGVRI